MKTSTVKIEPVTESQSNPLNTRKAVRYYELEQVIKRLPKSARILEIGAGAGWQAKELSKRGYTVDAIDIPESNYTKIREWEVIDYDGNKIPFDDYTFDVVFSSNVLEHVPHVEIFQKEILRVLKDDGMAIHIMPSAVWRTLTFLNFYPDRIKKFVKKLLRVQSKNSNAEIQRVTNKPDRSLTQKLLTMLIPPRHGETGTAVFELYLFSSYRWKKCFSNNGWKIIEVSPCGLCYSGQKLFGETLSIRSRASLAKILGSSCTLFLLKKDK